MKTTFEIPDLLFTEVKTLAAQKNKRMKDLVTRGLELVLSEEKRGYDCSTPLQAMEMVRENPIHSSEEIEAMMSEMNESRKMGWEYPGEGE